MIAWKSDNNGETYVASPYPLPWLQGEKIAGGFEPVPDNVVPFPAT
jgi:hypothetical protein